MWLEADDMKWRKIDNYLAVFADLFAKRILFATPGKDDRVSEASEGELLQHSGHPLANQYAPDEIRDFPTKGVIDNLGYARLTYDKFQVIHHAAESCDQIRKIEGRVDAERRDQPVRTRWMWVNNRAN